MVNKQTNEMFFNLFCEITKQTKDKANETTKAINETKRKKIFSFKDIENKQKLNDIAQRNFFVSKQKHF